MKLLFVGIVLLSLFLVSCTDKEFIDMICDKPEGVKNTVLCWFLSSANEKTGCSADSDFLGACQDVDAYEGKCKSGKCQLEFIYSCQEKGIDAKCYMQGATAKCTTPKNQCSVDDQCLPKCDGKNIMEGKCVSNRCSYEYSYSCEEYGIDAKCVTRNRRAECTQPENQCSTDYQCSDICKDDMAMSAYCNKGRCAWTFIEKCDVSQTCIVRNNKAVCV